MDHCTNGNIVSNGSYHRETAETRNNAVNNKKKTKKWSLGGLFKRRRAKSSDTDSSTELEDKRKGFLAIRSPARHKNATRKVVGKFETIIIPRNGPEKVTNGLTLNSIEHYDASPNVIKRDIPCRESADFGRGSNGSIENTSRRNEKQRIKAKVEAMRDRLGDSSSSDEFGGSSKTSNSSSLQRTNGEAREGGSSLTRKSRAARTDRYIRRHFRDTYSNSDPRLANGPKSSTPIGSPKSRWVARVVYQQSHDYPIRYAAGTTQSATSSPLNSPLSRSRDFHQCSSLPGKCSSSAMLYDSNLRPEEPTYENYTSPKSLESLPKAAPPPPPPRNPYRKILPLDKCVEGRPSSYAFDANTKSSDIVAYMSQSRAFGYRGNGGGGGARLQRKSNSDVALQSDRLKQNHASSKYCADSSPRSRNPIQLIRRDEFTHPVPNTNNNNNLNAVASNPMLVSENNYRATNDTSSLSRANEIGIPVRDPPITYVSNRMGNSQAARKTYPERGLRGRPLSVVSEKSDTEFLATECGGLQSAARRRLTTEQKPKNLEEALVELEEIYNSLRLSDEDLLDRAERRDLQSALRMNPNFSRHSWNDLDESGEDSVDGSRKVFSVECLYSPEERYVFSPRLPSSRRAARPDTVADDMAFRKLNKRGHPDPISNPNLVSQSGSFLLVSPALSPPPLVDVQPTITQINKEPDITLDDVVFRNMRHTNNTLKISDPQPAFGIPLGPVSPAPNSDYLHATPSEKYRSTFNPMRTPDVVKDDLAFRNLRKDVRPRPDVTATKHFIVPSSSSANDSRKRRAIRSLSANIVSMVGKDSSYSSENEDSAVDVNCNNVSKVNRCVSFNNLPDVLEDYHNRRRVLMENCDECLDRGGTPQANKARSVNQIANEARTLSKELREKLRELDAIPPVNAVEERAERSQPASAADKDVFRTRVALHKPITLSQFKIAQDVHAERAFDEVDQARAVPAKDVANSEESCEKTHYPKDQQPSHVAEGESAEYEYHFGERITECENSSSGVSSTSNSPHSSLTACEINSVSDFYLGATTYGSPSAVSPPVSSACSRDDGVKFPSDGTRALDETNARARCTKSQTLPNPRKNASSDELNNGRKCSRIEITLSPPQPSGTLTSLVPTLMSNFDVIAFAIMYFFACLHTVFFTTFSLLEMALLLISVVAYFIVYRRR